MTLVKLDLGPKPGLVLPSIRQESYNRGRISWAKFVLLAPNLAPRPAYNVENKSTTSLQFILNFNTVLGGRGNSNAFSKGKQHFSQTSVVKQTIR